MVTYCECAFCKKKKWCRMHGGTIGEKHYTYYACDDCVVQRSRDETKRNDEG